MSDQTMGHLGIPRKTILKHETDNSTTGKNVTNTPSSAIINLKNALTEKGINFIENDRLISSSISEADIIIPSVKIAIICDNEVLSNAKKEKGAIRNSTYSGWKVLRFGEHEIKNNLNKCLKKATLAIQIIEENVNKKKSFVFVDLFAGIGGFRSGLESIGGKCIAYSEIDKRAREIYNINFQSGLTQQEIDLGDIRTVGKINTNTEIDLITGGVPCQSWSIAGKKLGFDDPRGKLWEDAIRVVKINQPKSFIFENVKGLLEPRNKIELKLIIDTLEKSGYDITPPSLLNSYDFGLPQNRDRIYIVGFRKDLHLKNKYQYPLPINKRVSIGELIKPNIDSSIQKTKISLLKLHGKKVPRSRNRFQIIDELNDFFIFCDTRNGHTCIHSWDIKKTTKREKVICESILKNRRKKIYGTKDGNPLSYETLVDLVPNLKVAELNSLIEKNILKKVLQKYDLFNSKNSSGIDGIYRVYLPHSKTISTLTATGTRDYIADISITAQDPTEYKKIFIKEIFNKNRIRKITSKEAGKLQGFPPCFAIDENHTSAIKQFGNAVSVPVIKHLGLSIKNLGVLGSS